jgi:hypothetical protein
MRQDQKLDRITLVLAIFIKDSDNLVQLYFKLTVS